MESLAKDTSLSDASVSRYFKKKGYKTFQIFKNEFSEFMMDHKVSTIKEGFSKQNHNEQFCLEIADKIFDGISKEVEIVTKMIEDSLL